MVPRLAIFALALATLLPAQAPTPWRDAASLPGLDFSGLTADQKTQVLKILREQGCTCGCDMKLAQCRIEDPACSFSKGLAAVVIKNVRAGKSTPQVLAALKESPLSKGPAERPILEDPVKIDIAGAPVKGPENARVTLVEFSDFECPYCHLAVAEADAVLKAFPRDVRLVYKQFPLPMHPHARMAAAASLAANAQGKFWEMHDKLFANSRRLTRENIDQWAREIGLDMNRFNADLDSGKYNAVISKEEKQGDDLGVNGTPSFFINGKRYNGPFQLAAVKPLIESELRSTTTSTNPASSR